MDRTIDTDTIGKVDLKNDDVASGAHIINLQEFSNLLRENTDTNTADIDLIEINIDEIEVDIDNIEAAIVLIEANIDTIETDITNININIDDIEAEIALGSKKFISFADDAAYELANGAPAGGEVYYNSTTGLVRYYDAIAVEWTEVGGNVIKIQEIPTGVVDGVNTVYTLSATPKDDAAVMVYINGAIQILTVDFTVVGTALTMVTAPAPASTVYAIYNQG